MKKKIGCVIAYSDNHNNYGTALVGYALIKKVQDLGYPCEVIRYNKKLSFFEKLRLVGLMFRVRQTDRLVRSLKQSYYMKINSGYAENIKTRTKAVNKYKAEKLIPLFKEYDGYEALAKGSSNYSLVLVGSDQVWTPMSLYTKFFNLLFVEDSVPKVAYASSFGVSVIPKMQYEATRHYLNRFSRIGTREMRGKEIVESISDNKAQVVADPTLLLRRQEWTAEIAPSEKLVDFPYIFCYLLGSSKKARKAVEELKNKTGLKVVLIRHMDEFIPEDESFGDEALYNVGPNDFVKLISEAEYVCTDSFHCTLFSLQFHRKFMTFYRFDNMSKSSRNSRIDSLFAVLGIDERRLYKGEIIESINAEIDYEAIDEKLLELRSESVQFLESALQQVDNVEA